MGLYCLKLLIISWVLIFSVTAQVYQTNPQQNRGSQGYPNYVQDPYQQYQLPYPQYQFPYQQYQQPFQQYQQPVQQYQYGLPYGYSQFQPSVSEQFQLPYQQYQLPYQQPYQQYQQPYQQYQPYGYSQYQPSASEGRQNLNANSYPSIFRGYPVVYPNRTIALNSTVLSTQNNTNKSENATSDPFANVKTEMIDVDPQYFNYLMRYHNLQPQVQPQSYQTVPRRINRRRPTYNVTIGSNQFNHSSVPQVITKHDVQHKTFSFKKTYVITPENRNQKINLNFVNGVPVNDTAEAYKEEVTESSSVTQPVGTTVDENPVTPKERRFIEVPASCPEGTKYVDGSCFKKFDLPLFSFENATM